MAPGPLRTSASAALVAGLITLSTVVLTGAPAQADSIRAASWHLKTLRVAEAHRLTQGEGVTVAVIDSGVDPNHPDLRGNVLPGVDAYDTDKPGTTPRSGHGTGVASLIAGHGHGPGNRQGVLGIAPKAKILPFNVLSPDGRHMKADVIGLAMQHAIARGADVICVALHSGFDHRMVDAVKQGGTKGVIVVGAAGNTSSAVTAGDPARIKGALGVTSLDQKGAFSPTSVNDPEVDISAPGVAIPIAQPRGTYITVNGTSTAAALVAGAAALVRAKYPKDDWNVRLQRLAWTTDDRGPKGRDDKYGWGALNLMAALSETPEYQNGTKPEPSEETQSASAAPAPGLADGPDAPVTIDWMAGLYSLLAVAVPIGLIVWLVSVVRRRRRTPPGGIPSPPPPDPVPAQVDAGEQWRRPPGTDPANSGGAPPAGGTTTGR